MTKAPAATDQQPTDQAPAVELPLDYFEGLVPGRVVHYWPTSYQERTSGSEPSPGPWAAMVTAVSTEIPGRVVLNVNPPAPISIGTDPVCRMAAIDFAEEGQDKAGKWTWIKK